MELSTEDKERITKKANEYTKDWPLNKLPANKVAFRHGAEYATIYERERVSPLMKENERLKEANLIAAGFAQDKIDEQVNRIEELNNAAQLHVTMENGLVEKIKQLEAERSEVRNKVIEEAVNKFEQAIREINPHAYGSAYESVTLSKVIDFLNSLKTK